MRNYIVYRPLESSSIRYRDHQNVTTRSSGRVRRVELSRSKPLTQTPTMSTAQRRSLTSRPLDLLYFIFFAVSTIPLQKPHIKYFFSDKVVIFSFGTK